MQQSQPTKSYGVLDLLWDIRDAHSICKGDSTAKSILWALASRSDSKKGFTCFPALELIAEDISASVRTVRRHIEPLLTEGLIGRPRRYDDSYLYCVCVDKIRASAEKQRMSWTAEKETQSAHDEAFAEAVKANTTVSATPSSLAEDAAPPEAKSKTLVEYADTLAKGILNIEALAAKISPDEAQSLAFAICRDHAGSAPAIAVSRLTEEAISRAANAKTPPAYLRTVLAKKIGELCTEPYTKDESAIERLVDELLGDKKNGFGGFNIDIGWHPNWVDDCIAAIGRREGGILNSPYFNTDEVGDDVLTFDWRGDTESKEPTGDDDHDDADDDYGPVDPPVRDDHDIPDDL
jgi:Helix-turn-helix domain